MQATLVIKIYFLAQLSKAIAYTCYGIRYFRSYLQNCEKWSSGSCKAAATLLWKSVTQGHRSPMSQCLGGHRSGVVGGKIVGGGVAGWHRPYEALLQELLGTSFGKKNLTHSNELKFTDYLGNHCLLHV